MAHLAASMPPPPPIFSTCLWPLQNTAWSPLRTTTIKYLSIPINVYLSQNATVITVLAFQLPNYWLQNSAIPSVILLNQHIVCQGR
jgi:hypothetical protein